MPGHKSAFFRIFAAVKKIACFIILCIMFGAACQRATVQQFDGVAFGTTFHIAYVGNPDSALPDQVDSLLRHINSTFSIFDTNSLISKVNSAKDPDLNEDFQHVLQIAFDISAKTDGAFDCTVQPLVELWGFGRDNQKKVVPQGTIDSVKEFVGCGLIHLQDRKLVKDDPRVQLNFNAIAKGFAVDKVAEFLVSKGHKDCLVEIGGEIVAHGSKGKRPWKVGIQTPTVTADGPVESQRSFELRDRAVATSGNYRNFFEKEGVRYTHILNPVTGRPEETNLLSVTVLAPDCTTADAYATAFMVLGLEPSLRIVNADKTLEACFIYDEQGKLRVESTF